jgi:hypothetical protein
MPFANTGIGRSYGCEIFGTMLTEERIVWVAVSLARALRRDLPDEEWHPADSDQPVNVTLIGSQAFGKWRVGLRGRYASGVAMTPVTGSVYALDLQTWYPLYGEPFSARAPAFWSIDLRLDREWWFDKWKLAFYTEVMNATNHTNVEIPLWSEDFSHLDPVTGLPILPVIGVKGSWWVCCCRRSSRAAPVRSPCRTPSSARRSWRSRRSLPSPSRSRACGCGPGSPRARGVART